MTRIRVEEARREPALKTNPFTVILMLDCMRSVMEERNLPLSLSSRLKAAAVLSPDSCS